MNKSNLSRNLFMLKGPLARKGYDWWWHNFTAYNHETGESKAFFIEYFICNPALGNTSPILGQLPENKQNGVKPSYVMIKTGCWGKDAVQIHNFYPITDFITTSKLAAKVSGFTVSVGSCSLSEQHMKGSCSVSSDDAKNHTEFMCDAGSMSWDLTINKKIAFNVGYGASKFFRALNAFEMFWHAEGIKTEYSGEVIFNGVKYDVIPEKSFGYADKNWGADFTSPWLWISSCNLTSLITGKKLDNSAFEIGGGNPKVYGISLGRKLLGCMFYEGRNFEYNFSKPWTRTKIDFSFTEKDTENFWSVNAQNSNSRMELKLTCPKNEMLLVNYEAPNGKKLHNHLWNGGTGTGEITLFEKHGKSETLLDKISINNVGCEYGEYDK